MPKTIVVTGAAGYVGRHVVTALLDAGDRVIAVARPSRRREHSLDNRAKFVSADVLAPGFSIADAAGDDVDAVVHLAWQDGFAHNAPSHVENLSAHFAFLERLVDSGVPRIVVLGSMHEVGYWEGAIATTTPTNPLSMYGIAKDALRRASVLALSDRVELAWVRSYYIVGDDRFNQSIFTKILHAVDEGRTSFPFTSGANRYDFIDIDELGQQIAAVALSIGETGVINCCSGTAVALRDRVERFIVENDLPITLDYGAFPDRAYDSPAVWGDDTRIRGIMQEYRAHEDADSQR
jgi:dTDP-6-deoxy-L-talose 4-dehydrogenase (NAD+)